MADNPILHHTEDLRKLTFSDAVRHALDYLLEHVGERENLCTDDAGYRRYYVLCQETGLWFELDTRGNAFKLCAPALFVAADAHRYDDFSSRSRGAFLRKLIDSLYFPPAKDRIPTYGLVPWGRSYAYRHYKKLHCDSGWGLRAWRKGGEL